MAVLVCSFPAFATDQSRPDGSSLNVAVAECPPFVMTDDGKYSGLAIYLWEQVATDIGLTWTYSEFPLGTMLESIGVSRDDLPVDVGISCISVTAEREELIDFTHSFTETHTAIAVSQPSLGSTVIGFFSSPTVLKAILIVLGAAAVIGVVFFLLEHRTNRKLFTTQSGIGKSLETMIIGLLFVTNGPIRFYRFKTLTARVLATVLALSSTVLIAAVTAVLASSFTLNSLQSQVRSLNDLRNLKVGALEASTSSAFLQDNGIAHQTRLDLDSLVLDLDAGELDAIVSDAAFLQYRIKQGQEQGQLKSLTVLPMELEAQNYAFALDHDSPYREEINRTLLSVRKQRDWQDQVLQYMGE
jgi:polar amino acid transport system substrate-binding protein